MGHGDRTVPLGPAIRVPAIGQGTWRMGERADRSAAEVRALRAGIDAGAALIDTAEMYGEGGAERVVGEAIAGRRDEVVIVTKVYPRNAGRRGAKDACERSLSRLGTDTVDLYLLHWQGTVPLSETAAVMGELRDEGKIRFWGVSNLDTAAMRKLWRVPSGQACVTDQVLYHLASRGIEYDLLPWCRDTAPGLPVMAYSPLGQGGRARRRILEDPTVGAIARNRGVRPGQVALAWVIRDGDVVAVPKAADPDHARRNAEAAGIRLTEEELTALDRAFPPPTGPVPLEIL
ncbi:aldo/keto reductase [Streptomonospora salina]|uniref:Diketogulonate reductase-like aldo/keto reductase n=1 Tax=Streptomonospora salina TaxID=104205 RepID=A0A841E8Q2_9ACTN|nr:aldo/keto reductase [Streptomonospora salina]MBB5996900.1 diketogulonate reductase-like aldo/keto reductase [Streptomonospora salina]